MPRISLRFGGFLTFEVSRRSVGGPPAKPNYDNRNSRQVRPGSHVPRIGSAAGPLNGAALGILPILTPLSRRLSQVQPVRCSVTRSPPWRCHECLEHHGPVAVPRLPVVPQAPEGQRERVTDQMWHLHAGQDEIAAVGHDPIAEALLLLACPPEPRIAHRYVPRRRREQQRPQDHRLAVYFTADPIALLRTKGPLETERMILGHRRVPTGLLGSRHRLHRDRAHFDKTRRDGPHRKGFSARAGGPIARTCLLRR